MAKQSGGGSQLLALLVLLGLLGGAGAWNYRRNAAADLEVYRPYRSYSGEDLAALRSAFEQEVEAYSRRYRAATGREVRVAEGQLLAEQVREFERVQRISQATREMGREMSQREASIARIAEEQALRAVESDRVRFHLNRLLALPAF